MVRTRWLELTEGGDVIIDHFGDCEMRRQILVEAARSEYVDWLIFTELLNQIDIIARVAAEGWQQNKRRIAAHITERHERLPSRCRFSICIFRLIGSRQEDRSSLGRKRFDTRSFHELGHGEHKIEPTFEIV